MNIFEAFNNIFLKMTWLDNAISWLVERIGLNLDTWFGGMVQFFIYDTIKIFILLMVLIFIVSWIQSYFPPERTTKILQKYRGIKGNIIGALLGTLTPFCSCSSIPIFIGFTKAGLPIGITFSFLISSPLVDLASFILLLTFLPWQIAFAYVVVGIVLAIFGGLYMDKAHMEEYLQDYLKDMDPMTDLQVIELSKKERFSYAVDQVKDIIRRVWLYIIIGVLIGATIHNVIPKEIISAILGNDAFSGVFIATIVGIPMYADIFGTIPIAEALLFKGVPVGTILSFMMAVTALSLPSLILLKQVVKTKLLVRFVIIVTLGILLMGIVFNLIYINFMI